MCNVLRFSFTQIQNLVRLGRYDGRTVLVVSRRKDKFMLNSVRNLFHCDDEGKSEREIVCEFVKWTCLIWNSGFNCERVNVRIGVSHTCIYAVV